MKGGKTKPPARAGLVLLSAIAIPLAVSATPGAERWFAWCSIRRWSALGGIHLSFLDKLPDWIDLLPLALLWVVCVESLFGLWGAIFPKPEKGSEPEDFERRFRGVDSPRIDHLSHAIFEREAYRRIAEDLRRHGIDAAAAPARRVETPDGRR